MGIQKNANKKEMILLGYKVKMAVMKSGSSSDKINQFYKVMLREKFKENQLFFLSQYRSFPK